MIGLALLGICYGGASSTSCATMPKFFGMKNNPAIYGAVTFALVPSAIIGPILSSKLQELSNGAYLSTFIMILVVSVLTFIVNLLVDYFCKKDGLEIEKKSLTQIPRYGSILSWKIIWKQTKAESHVHQ
jgi:OFA family oxalate/formate antiporter-like MFS transporter